MTEIRADPLRRETRPQHCVVAAGVTTATRLETSSPKRGRARAAAVNLARWALDSRRTWAGVRRRFAPHQLRHAHAVEMAREGVPLNVIQRQLGHAHLGITSVYLQGIDNSEIIETVGARAAPTLPASAGLR
jgi:integrase